jgi:hypothetical protein
MRRDGALGKVVSIRLLGAVLCCLSMAFVQRAQAEALDPHVAVVLAASSTTSPDTSTASRSEHSWVERFRAHAEVGTSGRADAESSLRVYSPLIGLDTRFSNGFGIGFDWGFILGTEMPTSSAPAQWITGPGDPLFKVWYESGDTLQLYIGATVPAAWLPRDVVNRGLARNAYAFAAATRGLWNAWLWAPEQLALALGGRWQHDLGDAVRFRLEAAVAAAASVSWLTRDIGMLYGQVAPVLELHSELLRLGLRAQAVAVAPQSDPVQFSIGAYLGVEQPHWSLDLHGLCNVDPPLGFIGTGLSVCGAWLSATVSP